MHHAAKFEDWGLGASIPRNLKGEFPLAVSELSQQLGKDMCYAKMSDVKCVVFLSEPTEWPH